MVKYIGEDYIAEVWKDQHNKKLRNYQKWRSI